MNSNFVSFYLIIVFITGPFFYFLPITESLKWDEVLLAKMLNEAPVIFLLGYLISLNKKTNLSINYILLIVFLFTCILSETYYYFVHPNHVFTVSVVNNIISYGIISAILYRKNSSFKSIDKNILLIAIATSSVILIGFSFSAYYIIKDYSIEKTFACLIFLTFIIVATFISFLCFLIDQPFRNAWYKTTIGIVCIVIVDVYTYNCIFVLNIEPTLLYTLGKIIFSIGILFFTDGILRNSINDKTFQYSA